MAAAKGRAIVDETVRMTQDAEGGIYTHSTAPGKDGAITGSFPRGGLQARDARDELISEKHQMMDGNGMSAFGQVQATDRDFEWLRKKRETEAFANLDAWIGKNFHKADPATRRWLQETYPEYYESRERLMTDRAKLALRIQLLKLRGPKNEKDLMLQWGLQTGRIKLDRDWDKIGPSKGEMSTSEMGVEQGRFKEGLFNFRRYLTEGERKKNMKDGNGSPNPFAEAGDGLEGFQTDSVRFPGNTVQGGEKRYPSFLSDVLSGYL